MMNPVRTTVGWLSGRLLLFLLILAALVAWDAYRDESTLFSAQLKGLVPDKALVARLQTARDQLEEFARNAEQSVNQRLQAAPHDSVVAIDGRIAGLQREIAAKEARRLSPMRKTVALMTGEGLEDDLKNEIEIKLLGAERDALKSIKGEIGALQARMRDAATDFEAKRIRTLKAWEAYQNKLKEWQQYGKSHRILVNVPGSKESNHDNELRQEVNRLAREAEAAGKNFAEARERMRKLKEVRPGDVQKVKAAAASIMEPLDALILTKRAAIDSATRQAERIQRSVQKVFLQALAILIVVTATPIAIKAFWYWCMAPLVEKRPPIRLRPWATGSTSSGSAEGWEGLGRERISAVSLEVRLEAGQELLVHPDYLQSSAHGGRKDTKWLLDCRYPLTSIAAGMAGLTRIRVDAAETYVVSSRNDPFAEVGVVRVPKDRALVLQPRNLVGLVQAIDRPIQIQRRWVFSLSAWITLQFRYLVFEGPGSLLVQGCRGVRLEPAGTGRAIDQNATMGFSANLAYAPKRSETFGAYLLGASGLFNDSFSDGPGYFVYEEMPYTGRRSGLTGRGLEGLTDGLMKVVGI